MLGVVAARTTTGGDNGPVACAAAAVGAAAPAGGAAAAGGGAGGLAAGAAGAQATRASATASPIPCSGAVWLSGLQHRMLLLLFGPASSPSGRQQAGVSRGKPGSLFPTRGCPVRDEARHAGRPASAGLRLIRP